MTAPFRCTTASAERGEPLVGTASTVRSFLVVEAPGPWGADAVRQNRLPAEVMAELARRAARSGVRLLMARRHGRSTLGGITVLGAHAHPDRPRLGGTVVGEPSGLLDLDLSAIAAGGSADLSPAAPVFLVCTHGKHDVCCAELGRPVAAALHRHVPEQTWEVSHIGGDRFAGNVLVLPDGLYYGRLTPMDAVRIADGHAAGRLDLTHLRGRSGYPFAVQAAETHLLRHLGRDGVRAARLLARRVSGDVTEADFAVEGRCWTVRVRAHPAGAQQLTCRATRPSAATRHELVSVIPTG